VSFDARLLLVDEHGFTLRPDEAPLPTSWTVTFGLGGPAANTYTEVRFPAEVLDRLADPEWWGVTDEHARERILDETVRQVAEQAYGRSWAFHYRPDQYDESVARWSPRRREVLVVERLEVYP
jgi:hypothetical protein